MSTCIITDYALRSFGRINTNVLEDTDSIMLDVHCIPPTLQGENGATVQGGVGVAILDRGLLLK